MFESHSNKKGLPMTPKRGLKRGLLVSGILLILILVGVLWFGVSSYDGYCISFEPPRRPCNLLEYLFPYTLLLIVFSAIGKPMICLSVFVVLLAFPIIGYVVGKRRFNRECTMEEDQGS
jgi:hypothetical protein